jgi:hypothetical protein
MLDVATVGERFFATEQCDGGYYTNVGEGANRFDMTTVEVGQPRQGSICGDVGWHFAARPGVAVAIGSSYETDEPRAMVSVGE